VLVLLRYWCINFWYFRLWLYNSYCVAILHVTFMNIFVKNFVSCPFVMFSVKGVIRLVIYFHLIPILVLIHVYVHNIF
jgi:hypothetical protein